MVLFYHIVKRLMFMVIILKMRAFQCGLADHETSTVALVVDVFVWLSVVCAFTIHCFWFLFNQLFFRILLQIWPSLHKSSKGNLSRFWVQHFYRPNALLPLAWITHKLHIHEYMCVPCLGECSITGYCLIIAAWWDQEGQGWWVRCWHVGHTASCKVWTCG